MTEEIKIFSRVYDVETVYKILGLGRNCIYQFLENVFLRELMVLQDNGTVK